MSERRSERLSFLKKTVICPFMISTRFLALLVRYNSPHCSPAVVFQIRSEYPISETALTYEPDINLPPPSIRVSLLPVVQCFDSPLPPRAHSSIVKLVTTFILLLLVKRAGGTRHLGRGWSSFPALVIATSATQRQPLRTHSHMPYIPAIDRSCSFFLEEPAL